MADIGATLREARMRQKIDISEVEAETKIRAKYLRALENEEWGLLPGATFVKTFLRTYAEFLGLDARLLLEEYKLRFEPANSSELPPLRPLARRREARMRAPGPPRGLLLGVVVVGLLLALFLLGSFGNDNNDAGSGGAVRTTPVKKKATTKKTGSATTPSKPANALVRLQVIPTAAVWVCLENANGDKLIPGATQQPGGTPQTYRSRKFLVVFGNGHAQMRIDGKVKDVPDRSGPVGYRVTSSGRVELPADKLPCQ